jgi:tRNA(Met) cytidine acetyltransferase
LDDRDWQIIAGVGYGPGTYEAAPHVFRTVAMSYFLNPSDELSDRQERLLVRKVLQGEPWESVASGLGYESTSQCMREMGAIARAFCEAFGGDTAAAERERYT